MSLLNELLNKNYLIYHGDWGLGIGDWGLGIGPNPQSPIPKPQSPIPTNYNYEQKIIYFKNNVKINNLKILI